MAASSARGWVIRAECGPSLSRIHIDGQCPNNFIMRQDRSVLLMELYLGLRLLSPLQKSTPVLSQLEFSYTH